jgi:hypothetical protein
MIPAEQRVHDLEAHLAALSADAPERARVADAVAAARMVARDARAAFEAAAAATREERDVKLKERAQRRAQ